MYEHSSNKAGNDTRRTVDDGLEMARLKPVPVNAAADARVRRRAEDMHHFLHMQTTQCHLSAACCFSITSAFFSGFIPACAGSLITKPSFSTVHQNLEIVAANLF